MAPVVEFDNCDDLSVDEDYGNLSVHAGAHTDRGTGGSVTSSGAAGYTRVYSSTFSWGCHVSGLDGTRGNLKRLAGVAFLVRCSLVGRAASHTAQT